MLSKNEVKYIQNLYHKKTRDAEGLFIAEGVKIADELLASNYIIEKLYAVQEWQPATHVKTAINIITNDELQRITGLQTANKVLAVVKQKVSNDEPNVQGRLSLVLDAIRDPGNMGTIIRIADWFGIKQVICSDDCVEVYNPKVVQSSMGSFIRTDIFYKNLNDWLPKQSADIYGAMLNGNNVSSIKIKEGLLVIGNEGKGISDELQQYINQKITIPRLGGAESLNAAVATGIILSHVI